MVRCIGHFFSAVVLLLTAMPSYAFNAGIGAEGGVAAGGYGARIGFEVGTDTSSGLIKYDLSIEIGHATGKGIDLSTDLIKLGTGDYIPEKGGKFKFVGEIPLGKNASFSGTIMSDGTYEGSIEVVTPKGLKVSFDVDSSGKISAGAGAKISAGEFSINGGVFTYHISGVLYDPDAPVDSYTGAVLKGLGDAWTAPGKAVAQTQIAIQNIGRKIKDTWSKFKDPLEHPFVIYYKKQHSQIERPKIAFINIDDYCETRDLLGIEKDEKGPFAILTEDYTFYDLDGTAVTIPKGFIFDGASFPDGGFLKFLIHGAVGIPGGRYDYRTLASGLIHDYMYRNPESNPTYTKDYADLMFMINSDIAGHPNPRSLWTAVQEGGGSAYRRHQKNRDKGLYAKTFTSEYYRHNMEIYEKYGRTERWTTNQLHQREGVSIDNEDCVECKIGGKDPNIVDNRKGGSGSGSGGNGGAGSGSGGGGGGGDGSGGVGTGGGSGGGAGTGTGVGGGTGEETNPDEGSHPGVGNDPGYGLPEIDVGLPDVTLPNADGTKPWDNIVGFELPYDRMLFLLSGDIPDGEDMRGAWDGLVNMFKNGVSLTEFRKMWKTLKDSKNLISDKLKTEFLKTK